MQISLSELKNNPGKYVALAEEQDIFITKHGIRIAKLTSTRQNKVEVAKSLFGILPSDVDLEAAQEERLQS